MNPLQPALVAVLMTAWYGGALASPQAHATPIDHAVASTPRATTQGNGMTSAAPLRSPAAVHVTQQLVTMLTTLQSSEELSPEHVGQHFGVHLGGDGKRSIYRSADLGGGWNFGVAVTAGNASMKRGFEFWFYNPRQGADPTPICVLSVDELRKQLIDHGFVERFTPSEVGRVDWVDFSRGDIVLTVTRRDLLVAPNGDECFSRLQTTDGR